MWRQVVFFFLKEQVCKKNTVSANCSLSYALKRPKFDCSPALDSLNQNTITLKLNCIIQKAEMKSSVLIHFLLQRMFVYIAYKVVKYKYKKETRWCG